MDSHTKQAYWTEHHRAWRASGLTQAAYCERHGLTVGNFAYWLGKQRKQAVPLTLVPIPLGAGAHSPVLLGATGWRLELPAQVSPDWLADLLRRLP